MLETWSDASWVEEEWNVASRSFGTARAFIEKHIRQPGDPADKWEQVRLQCIALGYDHYWRLGDDWWPPADVAFGLVPKEAYKVTWPV
jgi:hypothetical protein